VGFGGPARAPRVKVHELYYGEEVDENSEDDLEREKVIPFIVEAVS
jgi:hypothetical protein